MKNKLIKNKTALSLIEIVMVLVIIGLLAAIITPRVMEYKKSIDIKTTAANWEILKAAITEFRLKEDQWPNAELKNLYDGNSPSGQKYINRIPYEFVSDHPSNKVAIGSFYGNATEDIGGWYWNTSSKDDAGTLLPNMTWKNIFKYFPGVSFKLYP